MISCIFAIEIHILELLQIPFVCHNVYALLSHVSRNTVSLMLRAQGSQDKNTAFFVCMAQ
jgi:hypothetical protein